MSNFDELLRNNASFAKTGTKGRVPEIPFLPNKAGKKLSHASSPAAEMRA
jgi:hypothetical protein